MIRTDISLLANEFWGNAGGYEDFPRTLENAVIWALPLAIVKIPNLGFHRLKEWLASRKIQYFPKEKLHGFQACLIAKAGRGIVFQNTVDTNAAIDVVGVARLIWCNLERIFRSWSHRI